MRGADDPENELSMSSMKLSRRRAWTTLWMTRGLAARNPQPRQVKLTGNTHLSHALWNRRRDFGKNKYERVLTTPPSPPPASCAIGWCMGPMRSTVDRGSSECTHLLWGVWYQIPRNERPAPIPRCVQPSLHVMKQAVRNLISAHGERSRRLITYIARHQRRACGR
jgi:hypothetical protein